MGNGLKINHLVEVDFKDFPAFIDALGGITVNTRRGSARRRSTTSGRASTSARASIHLDGERALGFARVRKNPCAPAEDDRERAARQQQVLAAIGAQASRRARSSACRW